MGSTFVPKDSVNESNSVLEDEITRFRIEADEGSKRPSNRDSIGDLVKQWAGKRGAT